MQMHPSNYKNEGEDEKNTNSACCNIQNHHIECL